MGSGFPDRRGYIPTLYFPFPSLGPFPFPFPGSEFSVHLIHDPSSKIEVCAKCKIRKTVYRTNRWQKMYSGN